MTRSQHRKAWWFSLPALFTDVTGQTTHTVTVGAQGSFYDPPTISASLNDTVSFVFAGPLHSVVQADFDSPCFPKVGGFSSGLTGVESNQSTAPVWNLKISNDSQAIWFYCANTRPSPHCAAGMVGAINPPSIPVYSQYLAAAKQVTGFVPTTSPPVVLTGVGAFATASPTVPTPSTSPATATTPASNSASSTSAFPSPTSSTSDGSSRESPSSSSSSHKRAAIIGGVVGGIGGLVLLVLLFAYFMVCSSTRRRRRNSKDFFRYRAKSPAFERALDMYTPAASAGNSAAGGGAGDARAALLAGAGNASNSSSTGSPSGRSHVADLPTSVRSTPASSPAMSVPLQLSSRSGHAYAQGQQLQPQRRPGPPPSSSSTLSAQGVVTGSSPSAALRQLQHHPRPHQHYQASGKSGGGGAATQGQDVGPTNIQALAKEVAAVLSQTAQQQPQNQQQQQQEEPPVKHDMAKGTSSPPSRMSELSGETPAPPKYQPS